MLKISLLLLGFAIASQGRVLSDDQSIFRIVNGTSVKKTEIPFQVSLQYSKSHFCGGSILNQHYVITAGHCVHNKSADGLEIIVGTVDLEKPYMTYEAAYIKTHENFNSPANFSNDIALIKVKTPFKFSKRVQPAALPKLHAKIRTNATAVVSGWGILGGKDMIIPTILQKAKIRVVDPKYCRKIMREKGKNIEPTQICANDPNTRRGQCNGDSGGPLIVNRKLTGIVSYSIKDPYCASTKYPGVYTRVSEYVNWILKHAV